MTIQLEAPTPRRGKPPRHLADLDSDARRAAVADLGLPAFRADQLSRHYFGRLTSDPQEMTDLPAELRAALTDALLPPLLTPARTESCDDGATRKTVWRLFDDALVESVLMRYPGRTTICGSSQGGSGMPGPPRAPGQAGRTRTMATAERGDQAAHGARAAASGDLAGPRSRLGNVVF